MKKKIFKMKYVVMMLICTLLTIFSTKEVKAGTDFANATEIGFNQEYTVNYNVGANKESYLYYKFTTSATSDFYTFAIRNAEDSGKTFWLYNGPDNSYTKTMDEFVHGRSSESHTYRLEANKTYYFVSKSNKSGQAYFTVNRKTDDFPNDFASAHSIGIKSETDGNIEVKGCKEKDFFKFRTSGRNSFYEISLIGIGSEGASAKVYTGQDASYDHYDFTVSPSGTDTKLLKLEKNKTYYIQVSGSWDQATSYRLKIKEIADDASDDFSGAKSITLNKTKNGVIQSNKDVDFYKFKTKKDRTAYQIYIKNKSASHVSVTLYSRNDIASYVSKIKDYKVSGASRVTIPVTLKKNRTYYIKITGDQNASYMIQPYESSYTIKQKYPTSFGLTKYASRYSSSNYVRVAWNSDNAHKIFSGVQIYRSTRKGSGYKLKKTISNSKNYGTYYDYSVKKNKTYYYKMRYYVNSNDKKYYGKWTKVKSVKVKPS